MQEQVESFIENNDVEFKMVAIVNGEEVVVYTSNESFDDVSGYAYIADEAFNKYVMQDLEDAADLIIGDETEDLIALERGL